MSIIYTEVYRVEDLLMNKAESGQYIKFSYKGDLYRCMIDKVGKRKYEKTIYYVEHNFINAKWVPTSVKDIMKH